MSYNKIIQYALKAPTYELYCYVMQYVIDQAFSEWGTVERNSVAYELLNEEEFEGMRVKDEN